MSMSALNVKEECLQMRRALGLLILILLVARSVGAQTAANGTLRGTARDQQGAALPGVAITATSATVPGIFTAITDRIGQYRILDLPPGDYTLVAELAGFSRFVRTTIGVRAGLNLELDFVMTVGEITEVLEVRQDTPLLESQNAVRSVNIDGTLIRSMPLSERREWFGALTLAPGVVTSEFANSEKLLYVHGADYSANIVQIDGADVTPAVASTLKYIALNTDAIDDMQIKTSGVDASAPLGLGGVITIAAANGTNQLKGVATLFVQPRSWNGSNTPGGTSSTVDQRQVDASLGGPVTKDRVWAFGAYRGLDISSGISRSAAQLDLLRALVPGFTPFDGTNVAHLWLAKLTAQRSSAHQLSGLYQRDINPVSSAEAVTAHARDEATGGSAASARFSSIWSDHLTTRIGASYNDKRRDVLHALDPKEPLQRVYQSTIPSGSLLLGNGRLVDRGAPLAGGNRQPNSKLTLSFDAMLFTRRGAGSHELQAGVYAQPRITVQVLDENPNGGFVFEEAVLRQPGNLIGGVIPFHRIILDSATNLRLKRRGQDYAVYVQDAWRPTPRLTINPGVRIDRIVWTDQLFGVTAERSTAIGPRLGLNYALTADTRNIVKAHWVRVHDQPAQTGASVGTSTLGQRDLYDVNLDGIFETLLVTPATFGVTAGRSIDPDFHQPYVQEWGAGYAKQLPSQLTAGVDLVHRDFRDRSTLVETNSRFNGSAFTGYLDESFNQIFQTTNNRWNWPVYTSIEASLTKRTPRLQGIASYLRQWRHIGGTWQPNDPAAFIQPAAFDNDRGIGSSVGSTGSSADANSLSGTHMTQAATASAQWHDHIVRGGVTYRGPWDLLLATTYTFESGGWSGPIVTRIAAPDPAFGPATVTLSNGRRVANPLATTIRFAYPTRGDGQLVTPALHVWNVRVGRRISVRRVAFDASIDLFNVTNNDADQQFQLGANQTFNPLYGATTYRQLPRSAQLVVRASF
jgi:Carboxypeptidase regulatory-like domain/TonB dependent receptor